MRLTLQMFRGIYVSPKTISSSRMAATSMQQHFKEEPSLIPTIRKPKLVIFDKDGTLICFHNMWIPWAANTVERCRRKAWQRNVYGCCVHHAASTRRRQGFRMNAGFAVNKINEIHSSTGLNLQKDILQVLGFCPTGKKILPGLLAEGTMGQIHSALVDLLEENGIHTDVAHSLVNDCVAESHNRAGDTHQPISDIQQLFLTLRSLDIKIAICTADNRNNTLTMLRQAEAEELVDDVVCGDDQGSLPKPDPHNAISICRKLSVDPEDTVMVGDTVTDMGFARSAGLAAAIGVLSGVANKGHLQPHADILVDHVGHLVDLFSKQL